MTRFYCCFALLILLIACDEPDLIEVTVTPSATATVFQFLTALPEPTATATASPPTMTPTVTPIPTHDPQGDYVLVTPSADSLLAVYAQAHEHPAAPTVDAPIYHDYQDKSNFHHMLALALSAYSDDELRGVLPIIENLLQKHRILDGSADRRRLYDIAVAEALTQHNALAEMAANTMITRDLVGNFRFTSRPFDLNHDGVVDWLLDVRVEGAGDGNSRFIPVTRRENGQFAVLPYDDYFFSTYANFQFDFTRDMNGDGLPELLVLENSERDSTRKSIEIFSWQEGLLQRLPFDPERRWSTQVGRIQDGNFQVVDFDGDGVFDLEYRQYVGIPDLSYQHCQFATVRVQWDGLRVTETQQVSEPNSASCLTMRALVNTTDRELLDRIVAGLDSADWQEHPEWYAVIYTNLAAQQWLNGEDPAPTVAQIWQYGAHEYVDFLQQIWGETNGDFLSFCRTIYHEVPLEYERLVAQQGFREEDFGDYYRLIETTGSGNTASVFCPANALTRHHLANLNQVSDISTAHLAVPVLFTHQMNLDDDATDEQIAIIDAGDQLWTVWDFQAGTWQLQSAQRLQTWSEWNPLKVHFSIVERDVLGNEQPEIAILRRTVADERSQFYADKITNIVTVYDPLEQMLVVDVIIANEDSLEIVDAEWVTLQLPSSMPNWVYGSPPLSVAIDNEETAVYLALSNVVQEIDRQPLLVRDWLTQIDSQISAEMPNAYLVQAQLHYLFGYTYELEGKSADALTHYRQLIETFPDSRWTQLALTRLAPTP